MATAASKSSSSISRQLAACSARIAIGSVLVDDCTFEQAKDAIVGHINANGRFKADHRSAYIVTTNAQHIVLADHDSLLRQIYQEADLIVPDGVSLLLASRLLGEPLRERIPGVELFESLCHSAAALGWTVFFLGGRPGAADLAAKRLSTLYPGLKAATCCPPFGFEKDPEELNRVTEQILRAKPHIIFVGLGAPKQDYWIFDQGRHLGASILIGIGGSFEMVSGLVSRAPFWVRRLGCEWLFRFFKEPRRTWHRYSVNLLKFLYIISKQWLKPHPILSSDLNAPKHPSAKA